VAARIILENPAALPGPAWSRSVALLTRQALEAGLAEFWVRHASGVERSTFATQLVALRFYIDDPLTAREALQTWYRLSEACHHHCYELAPTAGELRTWLDAVAALVDQLALPRQTAAATGDVCPNA
jgi:hypothetical protein